MMRCKSSILPSPLPASAATRWDLDRRCIASAVESGLSRLIFLFALTCDRAPKSCSKKLPSLRDDLSQPPIHSIDRI